MLGHILSILAVAAFASAQRVTLDYGTFTGTTNSTTGTTSYLGIKYAEAPTGNLRFRAPVSPPTTQLGHVNATTFGKQCVQVGATTAETSTNSEDCLFINVFVSERTSAETLPVMVWFHGGGFNSGSSNSYPPDLLFASTAKPFIFVTFNYRLGAFGFLASEQVQANGDLNAGLLDQRAALEWVQSYISAFGGDPRRVTIWGESAGAASTQFHLIANGGDGASLFRAAMGDSPSLSFLPDVTNPYITTIFNDFSTNAGCADRRDTLSCLRAANGSVLASSWSSLAAARDATLYLFAPLRDGTFIDLRPIEAFTSGRFARVPVLFGSNTDEGQTWYLSIGDAAANPSTPGANSTNEYLFIQGQFANLTEPSFFDALTLYPLADYNNSLVRQSGQMYGELRYICPALLIPGSARRFGLDAYQFHYDNPRLGAEVDGVSLGTTHGSELIAFFGFAEGQPPNADDDALFAKMRQFWTSFVTDLVPTAVNATSWPLAGDNLEGSPRLLLNPEVMEAESITAALSDRADVSHELWPWLSLLFLAMFAASSDNAQATNGNATAGPSNLPALFLPPQGTLSSVFALLVSILTMSCLLNGTHAYSGLPQQPTYLTSTEDLIVKFQLLPAYDKYVRPKPKAGSLTTAGVDVSASTLPATSSVAGGVDKGKGKEMETASVVQTPGAIDGLDGEDEDDGKKKKNSYKHLIKALPGRHSMKKDDYLQTMMQVPPKERVTIVPFDQRTQREAFTVGLDGLKGWNSNSLVPESAQAREDRKRRKELKRLAKQTQVQAQAQAVAAGAASTPTASTPAAASVHAPAPRSSTPQLSNMESAMGIAKSSTPRPSIPRPGSTSRPAPAPTISTAVKPGTPVRTGPTTPTVPHPLRTSTPASSATQQPSQQQQHPPPNQYLSQPALQPIIHSFPPHPQSHAIGQLDGQDKRGIKREREETNGVPYTNGNGTLTPGPPINNGTNNSSAPPKAILGSRAGVDGARPRPVKKRKDLQGHARDVTTAPVQQQPTPQGV